MAEEQTQAVTRPMPTEQGILAFLARCDAFYPVDAVNGTIEQQRGWYDALCAAFSPALPAGLMKTDGQIGAVPIRRYRPAALRTGRHLLYLHGGGFVVGSLESHDAICAEIAEGVGAELTAVDYRLAPEHIWPSQTDDCYAVLKSLLADGHEVVLIGDSAGGNLAAGLAVRALRDGLKGVVAQALIYPALGGDLETGSYEEMGEAPGLTTADVRYYRDILKAPDDPVAHALRIADVRGLPPAYITTAHFDPLRDDGALFAARLAAAGIEVWYRDEPQMVHAWLRARHMSEGAAAGFRALVTAISHFAGSS